MADYYSEKLSAERLKRVYEIADDEICRYLQSEINFCLDNLEPGSLVVELGSGYGRVMRELAVKAGGVVGIDSSIDNLIYGSGFLNAAANCCSACMDAGRLGFPDEIFDIVICIQNGISAFQIDRKNLVTEAMRVTKTGGRVVFSTYSDKFWDKRLRWFEKQAEEGLLGEIDYDKTGDGVIVCKDGFKAATISREEFARLAAETGYLANVVEIGESSLFCVMYKVKL